jgi:transglutaminase-like putative cysteine protease
MRSAVGTSISVERFFEFSVLGLLSSGYLAVAGSGYLDFPTALATAGGILIRALMIAGALRLRVSARLVACLTIAYICFYPLDYLFVSRQFLRATVHLVFFLAVIKVLTAETTRDYLYLTVIAFLELLAAAVLSASLNFFAFLALFLIFTAAAFSSAEIRRSMEASGAIARARVRRLPLRLGALAVATAVGILALTAGMFFLLPRTARAAFQHLVAEQYHLPGFSNEVTLGQIGTILQQKNAVMHVRFFKPGRPQYLKWRGVALSEFDGTRWFNPPDQGIALYPDHGRIKLGGNEERWQVSRPVGYEVQLNADFSDALFLAGAPEDLLTPVVVRTATDSFRLGSGGTDGLRYFAYSFPDESGAPELAGTPPLSPAQREVYLQLPDLDPRIRALARGLVAKQNSDRERALAIQEHLRRSYGYTMQLPATKPADPLADFLFARRRGHCEYFASAMAVMLRSIGIPSRVVNGFQSGVWNPISGWYMIRASDAHSWVEAWLPGNGWTTFDPTPRDFRPAAPTAWSQLNLYLDAADTFWRDWVLTYDLDRQLTLAAKMQDSGRMAGTRWLDALRLSLSRWKGQAVGWLRRYGTPVAALGIALLCAWWLGRKALAAIQSLERVRRVERGEASASDATLLYLRMLAALQRLGFDKPPWLTPREFAGVLPACEIRDSVERLTSAYNELRFGGKAETAPHILQLLERLERA